jgi:hypothetical protein
MAAAARNFSFWILTRHLSTPTCVRVGVPCVPGYFQPSRGAGLEPDRRRRHVLGAAMGIVSEMAILRQLAIRKSLYESQFIQALDTLHVPFVFVTV